MQIELDAHAVYEAMVRMGAETPQQLITDALAAYTSGSRVYSDWDAPVDIILRVDDG